MKVGLSCLVTPREWTLQELITHSQDAGYEALELIIADEGIVNLGSSPAELSAVADAIRGAGIEVASVCPAFRGAPKDLMTADDDVRRASIETVKRCVDIAAGLGADTVLLTLGSLPASLYYSEAYANALQAMHRLAPHAEQAGVNLAIEYVWNWFLLSPMEFARFCDECASPRIGFYFDPGNMTITGHAEHWARICGPYIQKVHMKDFRRNGAQWPPLLEGDVNFPAVMAELRKCGYDGALISEVGPDTAPLEATAAAIRQIMAM